MLIQDAIRAAWEDHKHHLIARESWSLRREKPEYGPGILVTNTPDGLIYIDAEGNRTFNYRLSGEDLFADDWYPIGFPIVLKSLR